MRLSWGNILELRGNCHQGSVRSAPLFYLYLRFWYLDLTCSTIYSVNLTRIVTVRSQSSGNEIHQNAMSETFLFSQSNTAQRRSSTKSSHSPAASSQYQQSKHSHNTRSSSRVNHSVVVKGHQTPGLINISNHSRETSSNEGDSVQEGGSRRRNRKASGLAQTRPRSENFVEGTPANVSPQKKNHRVKKIPLSTYQSDDGSSQAIPIPLQRSFRNAEDFSIPISKSVPNLPSESNWTMPDTPLKPKESLTWQQLSSTANANSNERVNGNGLNVRISPRKNNSFKGKISNPPSSFEIDSTTASNESPTWQQELLSNRTSPTKRKPKLSSEWESKFTPPVSNSPLPSSTVPPQPFNLQELFKALPSNPTLQPTHPYSTAGILTTSSAMTGKVDKRISASNYAGPIFHTSPSPNLLPIPTKLSSHRILVGGEVKTSP